MKTIWQLREDGIGELASAFVEAAGGSPLVAKLLHQRGIQSVEGVHEFLDLEDYIPTSGLELPDMEKALPRIIKAIDNQENILIFGDFDVDGQTGTSLLLETLRYLQAKVSYYIPDRATEGHGLNATALCRLVSSRQIKLVITTDTGITNFTEVSLLNGLGVDTVITDHHEIPENLPQAVANVNPKLLQNANHPLEYLAGVGVAFKLCELLLREKQAPESVIESLLDLVAVGTVADMMPLLRENRYLVYRGLQVLNRRQRLGIQEILTQAGAAPEAIISSDTIGFTIGPRLNAIGRLETAGQAVELLTSHDPDRIRIIGAHLEFLNRQRQELCEKTYLEAEQFLNAIGGLGDRKTIVLASPDWHLGIIGIVASRLKEKYHVPVFMMVIDENKGEARCSARSIPGFHLHEALHELSHYFTHFGGHSGAGGFALKLERLEAFKRDLYTFTDREITEEQLKPVIEVDARLAWAQLTPGLVEMIAKMSPFGQNNPAPRFLLEKITVAAQRVIGNDGKHLKLILTCPPDNQPIEALLWNVSPQQSFQNLKQYHFVAAPELNTFNNVTKVQLMIEDFASAEDIRHPSIETRPVKASIPLRPTLSTHSSPIFSKKEKAGLPPSLSRSGDSAKDSAIWPPIWIDHRERERLDQFIGQMMLPTYTESDVIFFHEGKPPDIPFLESTILAHRFNVRPAKDLILWDLPPDLNTLEQVIKATRPRMIHLAGGKYLKVPLFPSERDYLKVIFQSVNRLFDSLATPTLDVELEQLASQLATTATVIMQGLILLNRLSYLETSIIPGSTPKKARLSLIQPRSSREVDASLEWLAFQQSLKQVGQFREWLFSVSLDTIKKRVLMEDSEENMSLPAYTIPEFV